MKIKKNKLFFCTSLMLSSLIMPIVFIEKIASYSYEYNSELNILINKEIESSKNKPRTVSTVHEFIRDLSKKLKGDSINIVNSNHKNKSHVSENPTYEETLASALDLFDFASISQQESELPADVALEQVLKDFVNRAEEIARDQYESTIRKLEQYPLVPTEREEVVTNEAVLEFPTNEPKSSAPMPGIDMDIYKIEVGSILHYWEFENKYFNYFKHTSMVTDITTYTEEDPTSGKEVLRRQWTVTEAIMPVIESKTYNDMEFQFLLKNHSIDVLTPRKLHNNGGWWNAYESWNIINPASYTKLEMARRMESKIGKRYTFFADKTDDDWYCSELVWYATSVNGYNVPHILEEHDLEYILPIHIYNSVASEVSLEFRW